MNSTLAELWTANAWGDVNGWRVLSVCGLLRECGDLHQHWKALGWDVAAISPADMVEFLKKTWRNENAG